MPKAGLEEGGFKRIKCFRGFHCMKAPLAVGKAGLEKSWEGNFKAGDRHSANRATRPLLPGFVSQHLL